MKKIDKNVFIEPTSIIDDGATIGSNTKIWHWVHVCRGAVIGSNCTLGQNVFIGDSVKIGNNVKIQNNVSIFDQVVLENNVFCGPSMVFTNVKNPRSSISRKSEFKKTLVKEGATLGANCTILCGVTIGENAFVAAGAVVTRNIKNFELVAGVPARQIGWMSEYGERIPLPIEGNDQWTCKKTNIVYYLKNNELISIK